MFLYADEAVLDGSTNSQGGVIGSGGWGEVHVDANKLTINGNICGSYGTMSNADKQLTLSVRAGTLDMTGDINVGNEAKGNSNFDRNTSVIIEADVLNLKGDIKVDNKKRTGSNVEDGNISAVNLTVNKTATSPARLLPRKRMEHLLSPWAALAMRQPPPASTKRNWAAALSLRIPALG